MISDLQTENRDTVEELSLNKLLLEAKKQLNFEQEFLKKKVGTLHELKRNPKREAFGLIRKYLIL